MKKLFFPRLFLSSHGNNNVGCPLSKDKELTDDSGDEPVSGFPSPKGLSSKSKKPMSDTHDSMGFRKKCSLSSEAYSDSEVEETTFSCTTDEERSLSNRSIGGLHLKNKQLFRCQASTPERRQKANLNKIASIRDIHQLERANSVNSSKRFSSSNSSIVDRYVKGEHQQKRTVIKKKNNSSQIHPLNGKGFGSLPSRAKHRGQSSPRGTVKEERSSHPFDEAEYTCIPNQSRKSPEILNTKNRNGFGRLPPRAKHMGQSSPRGIVKEKQSSDSFDEAKHICIHYQSRESPPRLTNNISDQLSRSHCLPESKAIDHCHDIPEITEDIYGRLFDGCSDFNSDVNAQKGNKGASYERISEHNKDHDYFGLEITDSFLDDSRESFNYINSKDSGDNKELGKRLKQADERVMLLSEELKQESFLRDGGSDVSALMQRIRDLKKEKMSLALEVSDLLWLISNERSATEERLSLVKNEQELQIHKLEKEKNELLSALDEELDRRSAEWSFKVEMCQLEEQRLRQRVRELAEQNVSLQREVYSFHERGKENKSMVMHLEQQLKDTTTKAEELSQENQNLQQNFSDIHERYKAAEEDINCIRRNFENKDKESKELHKSISKLLRVCCDQEKTIAGLREGFSEKMGKNCTQEEFDKDIRRLQMEQIRLTEIELALRKEVESYRLEVDSLRHENIYLLNRLESNGKDAGAPNFKLDKEMWTQISCLQNQGLSLLNESTHLCSKLLDLVKEKASEFSDSKQAIEVIKNGLHEQFIIDSETKIQGLMQGTESFTRSLLTASALLHEKSSPLSFNSHSRGRDDDECRQKINKSTDDILRSELKAESLLTTLLREKIYSKELEVGQLQAELATAVRGNDILRFEVQNAMDNLSHVTHKLKDLELQMLEKDENIKKLEKDLQGFIKEITDVRMILSKVSLERDLMWEEVKHYNEENMLLNAEVNMLKKQIETLEDNALIKDGQITILKDTIENKSLDFLGDADSGRELCF